MAETSFTSSSRRGALRLLLSTLGAIALGCILIDPLITYGLAYSAENFGAYKIHRMFDEDHGEEIVILGSSRAAGSFIPSVIADNAFNYGIEASGYWETNMLLQRELAKNRSSTVILNMDYQFFKPRSTANIAHFIPSLGHKEVRQALGSRQRWFHLLPTIRYFGEVDEYLKALISTFSKKNVRDHGGFFINQWPGREAFDKLVDRRWNAPSTWMESPKDQKDLKDLLAGANRAIVVAIAPYHKSYFHDFSGMDKADRYLAELDSLPNVTVINHGRFELPDSCFLNTLHVSYAGALAFSKKLHRELQEAHLLTK